LLIWQKKISFNIPIYNELNSPDWNIANWTFSSGSPLNAASAYFLTKTKHAVHKKCYILAEFL
jgi:hypothetical protein